MNKQIEEMARIMCGNYNQENNKCLCDLVNGICDLDCWAGRHPAEAIYNAGYRKQTEGEWILEYETFGKMICSNCKEEAPITHKLNDSLQLDTVYVKKPYCPNCGAKMRGGKG